MCQRQRCSSFYFDYDLLAIERSHQPAEATGDAELDAPTQKQVAALIRSEPRFADLLRDVACTGLPAPTYWARLRAIFGTAGDALGELLVERDRAQEAPVVHLADRAKRAITAVLLTPQPAAETIVAPQGWWKGLSVEEFLAAMDKFQVAMPDYTQLDWTHEVRNQGGNLVAEVAGFEEVPADDPSPWVKVLGASPIGYLHFHAYDRLFGSAGKKMFVDFGLLVEPCFQRLRRKG